MKEGREEQELRQKTVGRFIKNERERNGLTQSEVAKKLAYSSAQFISNWERGVALPPMDQLPRLALLLEISPRVLLDTLFRYQEELLKLQKRQLTLVFRSAMGEAARRRTMGE